MGAADFSDIGGDFEGQPVHERPLSSSDRRAFVRDLVASDVPGRRAELQQAIDTFVLTGAVKLHRQDTIGGLAFEHHTMLVHESVRMKEHEITASTIKELWNESGFSSPSGLNRLRDLYETDILPVSEARAEPTFKPAPSFSQLKQYIGKAVSRIAEHANNPVIVVNGDQDIQRNQQQLNFDGGSVWRVLVGGAKLSRGFTIEGLTVSYYRRVAKAHDTLTQAGRWCGFRHGYRDLVRVFIGRNEKRGTKSLDLLDAFDAVVQDEEAFRQQLWQYAKPADGKPQIRPVNIPPLVSQHLFWLKPTSNKKMFNAVLEEQREQEFGPVGYPREPADLEYNLGVWAHVLPDLSKEFDLRRGTTGTFRARLAEVSSADLRELLEKHRWLDKYRERRVDPWLRFFDGVVDQVPFFTILIPQPGPPAQLEMVEGIGQLWVVSRRRRDERGGVLGEPTEPTHRAAAERVTQRDDGFVDPDLAHAKASGAGVVMAYPVRDEENADRPKIIGFRIYLPAAAMPPQGPVVRFRAVHADERAAVVDAD
jgi:hypothetical protein